MDCCILKSIKIKFVILIIACFFCEFGFAQNDEIARIIKLDEAIQLGVQNNNQLKIANADVKIANENLSQSRISKTPKVGLNMGYSYIGNPKI